MAYRRRWSDGSGDKITASNPEGKRNLSHVRVRSGEWISMVEAIRLCAEVRSPALGTRIVGSVEWTGADLPTLGQFCRAADDLYESSPEGQGPLFLVVELEGPRGSARLSTRKAIHDPALPSLGLWLRVFGRVCLNEARSVKTSRVETNRPRRGEAGGAALEADTPLL